MPPVRKDHTQEFPAVVEKDAHLEKLGWKERGLIAGVVLFALACSFLFGLTDEANAAESPELAQARDTIHVTRCLTNPRPVPSLPVCKALVRATHEAGVPRKWASSNQLRMLLYKESSFNHKAVNSHPCSAGGYAMGLFQFCRNTWAGVGCKPSWSATTQSVCGYRYIRDRYKNPGGAWGAWLRKGWY